MTVIADYFFLVLTLTHKPFVMFSPHFPAEDDMDAVVGP